MNIAKTIIKLCGGYHKDEVFTEVVKGLYNTIGADDILKEYKSGWVVGGKPISEAEKKMLISEANVFMNMKLWQILQRDIKYKANKLMFERSVSENDLLVGKSWLYVLDCIKTRLDSLNNGRGVYNDNQ